MLKKYFESLEKIYGIRNLCIEAVICSFVIIFLDCINFFTYLISQNMFFLIILFFLFLIIIFSKRKNVIMFFDKNLNFYDKFFIILPVVFIICLLYVFFDYKSYKISLLLALYTFIWIVWSMRYLTFKSIKEINKNSIFDLKYIYKSPIVLKKDRIIFLNDEPVHYDLLNRKNVINQLYTAISCCYSKDKFVIGLNGKWGCGKTTVVKQVFDLLEDNNIMDEYLIVEFDPWRFDDDISILKGFLSEILEKINFYINAEEVDILISAVINIIFDNKNSSLSNFFTNELGNIKKKTKIEDVVNNYLSCNNKKLLIVIDNLDRINGDKALFLIKCIESIVKFENTIYLLLYDEILLNKMLNDVFFTDGNKYMDKIVQLKIDMPEVDPIIINNIKNKVFKNLIIEKNAIFSDLQNEELVFENIRELKRYINSLLSVRRTFSDNLNMIDSANLQYIKVMNSNLYYDIWNNKKFFIYYDRPFELDFKYMGIGNLNSSSKDYFDKLFSNPTNLKLKKTLSSMFPSVDNYFNNPEECFKDSVNKLYDDSVNENRISNARYFDLYFTNNENLYIKIGNDAKKIISIINSKKNFSVLLNDRMLDYSSDELRFLFESLSLKSDELKESKYYSFIIYLFNFEIKLINFELSSKEGVITRINRLIVKLISKLSIDDFDKLCNKWKIKYKYLNIFEEINFYYSSYKNSRNSFNNFYNEMCNNILNNKINIYSVENYNRRNIYMLYRYDQEKTKEYLKYVLNEYNVLKFLSDIIDIVVDSDGIGYNYRLNSNMYKEISKYVKIEKLINNYVGVKTYKEKLILRVYNQFVNSDTNNNIYLDKYFKLD